MVLPRVVAVCGARRVGKDTIASYLVEKYGYEHVKITTPLKEVCKTLFHFSDDQLETDTKELVDERWGVSPRRVMQFLGTEVFQYKIQELLPNVGRDFWIRSLVDMIRSNPERRYVISDMRFKHEYDALHVLNCVTLKVVSNRVVGNSSDTHASECEYKSIQETALVINNGTKEDLYQKIDAFFKSYSK